MVENLMPCSLVLNNQAKQSGFTLKCLSIRTLKTINFPFVPNGKLMGFRCPNIEAKYS